MLSRERLLPVNSIFVAYGIFLLVELAASLRPLAYQTATESLKNWSSSSLVEKVVRYM